MHCCANAHKAREIKIGQFVHYEGGDGRAHTQGGDTDTGFAKRPADGFQPTFDRQVDRIIQLRANMFNPTGITY